MYTHHFLVGTFDVVGVSVNSSSPMGLVCVFNTGSLARGCLVYLTDIGTGVTYCRVVWRSLDTPVNMSLCPSSTDPLSTGVHSVEVYDIERDGSVSSVPALAGEIVTVFGPSTLFGPSTAYAMSSCRILTADRGTIVYMYISINSIKCSMCSYQSNVPFCCLNYIKSTVSQTLYIIFSTKHFLTNFVQ